MDTGPHFGLLHILGLPTHLPKPKAQTLGAHGSLFWVVAFDDALLDSSREA